MDDMTIWIALGVVFAAMVFVSLARARRAQTRRKQGDGGGDGSIGIYGSDSRKSADHDSGGWGGSDGGGDGGGGD